jgi:hypothetical protein
LIDMARTAGMREGLELLQRAELRLKDGYTTAACNAVRAFQKQIAAPGAKLTDFQRGSFASGAQDAIAAMRCRQ